MKWKQPLTAALLLALGYVAFLTFNSSQQRVVPPTVDAALLNANHEVNQPIPSGALQDLNKIEQPSLVQQRPGQKPLPEQVLEPTLPIETEESRTSAPPHGASIPRPDSAYFSAVKLNENATQAPCPIDRPCQPEGRQGVLLLGVQFNLHPWGSFLGKTWSLGSYHEQTSLLVLK